MKTAKPFQSLVIALLVFSTVAWTNGSDDNGGNIDCPDGTEIAKFNWGGGGYAPEGETNGITMQGDDKTATWTSPTHWIRYVIIKGGTDNYIYTYDLASLAKSGTLSYLNLEKKKQNGSITNPAISNVKFCYVNPCPLTITQASWDGFVHTGGGVGYLNFSIPTGYTSINLVEPYSNVALNGVFKAAGYPGTKVEAEAGIDQNVVVELRALGSGNSSFFLDIVDECHRTLYVDPLIEWAGAGALPANLELDQNYPNPFNPVTTIRFHLPEAGHVQLAVYDVLGRRVKTLVNGQLEANSHDISWDGTNDAGQALPSGTYLYRIVSGSFSQVKQMTLLK